MESQASVELALTQVTATEQQEEQKRVPAAASPADLDEDWLLPWRQGQTGEDSLRQSWLSRSSPL